MYKASLLDDSAIVGLNVKAVPNIAPLTGNDVEATGDGSGNTYYDFQIK